MPAENYVLLETINLTQTASSITFDNLPPSGYTDLKIVTSTRLTGATTFNVTKVTLNGDTTAANYRYRQLYATGSGTPASGNGSQPYADYSFGTSYTANTFSNGEVYFPDYLSSGTKSYSNDAVAATNASAGLVSFFSTRWLGTGAITSITFTPDGSFSYAANSTFSLYGLAAYGTTPVTAPFATGGNIVANDGTYWYHAFLSSGIFTPLKALSCDVLVVAGGGGGGGSGPGGGAGGLLTFTAQSVAATTQLVTIGAGGEKGYTAGQVGYRGSIGNDSQFGSLTLVKGGGGGGANDNSGSQNGLAGGSGGGGGSFGATVGTGGSATSGQGNAGGSGATDNNVYRNVGGGGGAGAAGGTATSGGNGAGGIGATSATITAMGNTTNTGQLVSSSRYYAGGGGYSTAGSGGGGTLSTAGTVNTGGGGGGSAFTSSSTPVFGGAGGSGIVIVRYLMV